MRRAFVVEDLQRIVRSARFKALVREHKDAQAVAAKRAARVQREEQQARAKLDAAISREIATIPNLHEMYIAKIAELEAQIAELRGPASGYQRHRSLRG